MSTNPNGEAAGRERSFWGWGWADKFPDDAARKQLGDQVRMFLPDADIELRTPPTIDAVTLPRPRIAPPAALAGWCDASDLARASHTYGKNYRDVARGFDGDFSRAPDFVALPRSEADVVAVLDWCADAGVAAIPYGGGTSVVCGTEADVGDRYAGAVSIDLRGLGQVLEVDPVSRAARIQGGALGPSLETQLAADGMTLRHFPQSFEFSTLGGWIATRAGGHFATLYTHIDDLVESVRMVTGAGVYETRRLPGSGAGPSPDRLAIGSEGSLGIITEAWVRVRPRPRWRIKANVMFDEFRGAMAAARDIAQAGLFPANCRVLDAREALLNRIPTGGKTLLLLGFESADHPLGPWMDRALELARAQGGDCPAGAVASDDGDKVDADAGAAWKQSFIDMPYMLNSMVSIGMISDTFETAVTWDRFDELHAGVIHDVRDAMQRVCGGGLITCRITHVYPDGPAPYFTFIAPGKRGGLADQWMEIRRAAGDAVIRHGGTITHHHAVGRLHRPWYDQQRPDLFAAALRAAKRELDPAGVLNPGVLIDL